MGADPLPTAREVCRPFESGDGLGHYLRSRITLAGSREAEANEPKQPHAPRQSGPSTQCQLMNSQEPSSSHARAWTIASSYERERPSDSAAANAMAPNASRARSINTSSLGSG